jgi:hypothetical protein
VVLQQQKIKRDHEKILTEVQSMPEGVKIIRNFLIRSEVILANSKFQIILNVQVHSCCLTQKRLNRSFNYEARLTKTVKV